MANVQTATRPDNNKRLAALESSVSALAIALTANGVDVPEGGNVIEIAIGAVKANADLRAKVAELEAGPTNATEGEIAAIARAETAEARAAELQKALDEAAGMDGNDASAALEDQLDDAQRKLAIANARIAELEAGAPANRGGDGGDEIEEVATVEPRERPASAADVGPDYSGIQSSAALIELVVNGDVNGFELAFSNGEYEIVALNRVPIGATDLVIGEGRLLVSTPVHAKLAATDAGEELHGVGLLIGGEQVGYCALLDPIKLEPGTERRFDRSFYF